MSSHILHEIEALTDRILLIHRGRVLAEGRIEEIRFLIENQPLTYRIVSRERRRIAGELAKLESVMALTFAEPPEDALEVRTNRPAELFEVIQKWGGRPPMVGRGSLCGGRQFGRGLPVLGERVSHPMSMLSQIQALTRITNYQFFRGKVRLVLLLWVGLLPSLVKLLSRLLASNQGSHIPISPIDEYFELFVGLFVGLILPAFCTICRDSRS
ncbi:MAG: hypothetical protein KatS3mg130_0640 [Candidatus Sumerlaea sp.]|nr:MAG: hypothetical protein KatS3mg130_0640 [Candidatus Sumerlaea sp.]